MQVAGHGLRVDDETRWRRDLARGASLLAAVLAGAALVFWVAANWSRMMPDARLAGVQGALALCVVMAAVLAWRGHRATESMVALAALATGARWPSWAKYIKRAPMPGNCSWPGPY